MSKKKKKFHKGYIDEVNMLHDLQKCAIRYLTGAKRDFSSDEQYKEDEKYAIELGDLCSKYVRKLEKKCIKNTGKRLDGTRV